jgi:DNA-binding NtrC family response regulator
MANSTILVVDDDIVVLAALSKLLNVFGYIVAGASNSQAAMDYVTNSRKRFDLIITDLAMPGIDGVQFMTAAKSVFPDIPIVVMTGYSERCTPEEALRLGAFAYVSKPFNIPEVVSTIERALRRPATTASWPRTPAKPHRAASLYPDKATPLDANASTSAPTPI